MLQPTHEYICPVSGLTVRREPDWTDVPFENNFKIAADVIGQHILLTHRGVNLPVVRRPEWAMQTDEFQISFEIIAGRIIHSVSSGYLRDIHLPGIIALRDELVASIAQLEAPGISLPTWAASQGCNAGHDADRFRASEIENMKKDGSRAWVYWNNRPIKNAERRIVEILVACR